MSPSSPTNKPYRRLPGSGGGNFSRHRLWLGDDHVLSVGSSLIGERYRRFYFRDIQALVWRATADWWVRASLWFAFASPCAFGVANTTGAGRVSFAAAAALFIVLAVVEVARGKTCACFVKTAVQFERLPSLNRERALRRMLAQLRPRIVEAQAGAAPSAT